MTIPNQLSLEALIAEDGLCVTAGLPESLRQQLDAGRKLEEQAGVVREKAARILTEIAVHQAEIAKLHEELRQVLREFPTPSAPFAPAATPAA